MNPPSRRQFVAGSVVTITSIAGCLASGSESDPNGESAPENDTETETETEPESDEAATNDDLPTKVERVLEVIPPASDVDAGYEGFVFTPLSDDDGDDTETEHGVQAEQVLRQLRERSVDPEEVTTAVTVIPDGNQYGIGAAVGSFDRVDLGTAVEEDGDWYIGDDGDRTFASEDGRVLFAGGDDDVRSSIVETGVDAAQGETESVLAADPVVETFTRLDTSRPIYFVTAVDENFSSLEDGTLRAISAGFGAGPRSMDMEGTAENEYLLFPATDAELDDEAIGAILDVIEYGEIVERDVDREEDVVYVETLVEAPPEWDSEASPDATVHVDIDRGVVTFEHTDGESVDSAHLELYHDGELAAVQPSDEYETFDVGDTISVDTGPLAHLELRWIDEEANVYDDYASVLVGEDSFETAYDLDEGTAEFTYTGELEADPELLAVTRRREDGTADSDGIEQFSDAFDVLTAGDSVTVDDVEIGDRVSLELDVDTGRNGIRPRLATVRASPPRIAIHSHPDDGLIGFYYGEEERDADEFRVLVDGEPAAFQFDDDHETLTPRTEIELGEVPLGSRVTVEWLEPDEPIEIEIHLVRPRIDLRMAYGDADGTVTVEHRDGDAVDADDLELRIDGEPAAVQPADEYDTFESTDALTVDVEPFRSVGLVWIGVDSGEDDSEHEREYTLGRTVTGEDAIEGSYDVDREEVELVYVGAREADPSRIGVVHRGDRTSGEPESLFEDAYETLTDGDSIVVENVGVEDRVTVMLTPDADAESATDRRVAHTYRPIFRLVPEPRHAFTFDHRDDELVATYHQDLERDADEFRILADGEETVVQPADEHETLEADDEVALGSIPAGTELVVEWVAPDEPTEVSEHVVVPNATFDVEYDADAETVTLEHAGGDEFDADDLSVMVEPSIDEPTGWDGHETITEGDTTTIDTDEDEAPRAVYVIYRERELVYDERLDG
ncbi:type IV pilin N-terminal domain-containing protein [Halomontanus rarus]|uniref:type IV pilin N-terminal domain-containing protein n=1 Tax=Halomontanus rarus TaxID=3034020 RepID=UPI0023E89403|nr:type IV pilin N-terminal domain-containing protein [Halovivax sp. TS33]